MKNKNKNIKTIQNSAGLLFMLGLAGLTQAETKDWMERVELNGYIAQGWQSAIEVDKNSAIDSDQNAQSGFQRLRFALNVNAQINDRVSIFAELAEEPNDFSGITPFAISQDLAWVEVDLNKTNSLRIGNIVAYPGSLAFLYYSDGAAVQANPLIGNTPVDMITAEEGIWLTGKQVVGGGDLFWDFTLSTPSFASDFSDGAGYNYKANITYALNSGFGMGFGVFMTSGDPQCDGGVCVLTDGGAVNSAIGIGDGDNYEFSTGGPATRATHVAIIPAIDATIWQADLHYSNDAFLIQGFYGIAQDNYSFLNGFGSGQFEANDAELRYLSITSKLTVSESLFLSARYSMSENESDGISAGDNVLDRLQIGVGYWFDDSILLKAEYVKQTEEANSGGLKTNGFGEAEWDGVSVELSIGF